MFALITSHPAISATAILCGPVAVFSVLPHRAKLAMSEALGAAGPLLVAGFVFLVLAYAANGIQHDPALAQVDACTDGNGWTLCHAQ